ncbi:hypothetical protein BGX24_006697 [Mortierella sp. AD032]|nr:hypothetical protein BGX24_006697 [Mortierella sp. AD032]
MAESEDTADKAPSSNLYFIKEAREASVPQPLTGSHDLISIFKLQPLYDQYVKQKLPNNEDVPPIEPTYFPFIKQLPGKNDIRPGNYIRQLLEAPEKTYQPIHQFSTSTLRDAFSLRVGPVPGFDPSVLGTDEGAGYKRTMKNLASLTPAAGQLATGVVNINNNNSLRPSSAAHGHVVSGYSDPVSAPIGDLAGHSSHSHSFHHGHSHHGSKSSTSSPYVEKAERGEDGSREHRHKKKKKKRKHEHDHEHGHHEGDGDSEHRKKKKRKREREEHGEIEVV